jgi:diguanylate cyclase (GGDEF)-like protein
MSTLQRLLLAFGVIVAITAAQGILMSMNLDALAGKSRLASTKPVEGVDNARAAWSAYLDAKNYLDSFMEMTRPEDSKVARAKFDEFAVALDRHLDRVAATAISAPAIREAEAVRAEVTHWVETAHVLLGIVPATSIPAPHAMALMEAHIRGKLDGMVELTLRDAANVRNDIETLVASMGRSSILIVMVAMLAGTALAVLSSLTVTRPIRRIGDVLRELANGNKSVDIPFIERSDEVGDTARAAKAFRDNLFLIETIEVGKRDSESQADRRIRHLAHHDGLTGLMNRSHLIDKLDDALTSLPSHGGCLAVHFLDLDRFKDVNDTYGHDGGDFLLETVAERLRAATRPNDVIARLGGDEFIVVQPNVPEKADAESSARRFASAIAAPTQFSGHEIVTTVSIGVALAPADGNSSERLLKSADLALYKCKADGRDCIRFFRAEMDAEQQGRIELERLIRDAVVHDRFELHYQPLIELSGRRLVGFEALIRLPKPDGTLISPGTFVPVAEEMRVVDKIGVWVLREACRTASTWPSNLTVAVNLSPLQFATGRVSEVVAAALDESTLQPNRLELEITETLLLRDSQAIIAELKLLKGMGVSIVMDDFGTGYSSLSYLWRFPFDKIKIDGSFMRAFDGAEREVGTVVKAIVALGRDLHMRVTVEGIETAEQVAFLDSAEGDQAQGFYFGRPVPASELAACILADFQHRGSQNDFSDERRRNLPAKAIPLNGSSRASEESRSLAGANSSDTGKQIASTARSKVNRGKKARKLSKASNGSGRPWTPMR